MSQIKIKTHEGGGGDDILLGTFSLVGLETSPWGVASAFGTANWIEGRRSFSDGNSSCGNFGLLVVVESGVAVDGETLVDCESGDGVFDGESIGRPVALSPEDCVNSRLALLW